MSRPSTLSDVDLAILGAPPSRYERYVVAVRSEYAHVDDRAWRRGRAEVLTSFLDRPAIYHHPRLHGLGVASAPQPLRRARPIAVSGCATGATPRPAGAGPSTRPSTSVAPSDTATTRSSSGTS